MTISKNKEDYLHRKIQLGEKVISVATTYGSKAMTTDRLSDNFVVLAMNKNNCSVFQYKVLDGKFCVKESAEEVPHRICDFIKPEMLGNDAVTRWWKCVFYERKGICTYDNYYDSYKISDDSDISFFDLIDNVTKCVSSLPIIKSAKQLFLTGELMKNPVLRYVLQELLKQGEVRLLPEVSLNEDADENELVILPMDRLERLALNTIEAVKLKEITSASIPITLPLDSMNDTVVSNVKWKDLIDDKQGVQKDYSVGDLDFKNISLRVECDAFQNIFLACQDLNGNRKVVKIN